MNTYYYIIMLLFFLWLIWNYKTEPFEGINSDVDTVDYAKHLLKSIDNYKSSDKTKQNITTVECDHCAIYNTRDANIQCDVLCELNNATFSGEWKYKADIETLPFQQTTCSCIH